MEVNYDRFGNVFSPLETICETLPHCQSAETVDEFDDWKKGGVKPRISGRQNQKQQRPRDMWTFSELTGTHPKHTWKGGRKVPE